MTLRKTQAESTIISSHEGQKSAIVLRNILKPDTALDAIRADTRSGLAKTLTNQHNAIDTRATLRALGKTYNYHPKPSTSEKVELTINWEEIEGSITQHFLGEYDQFQKDTPGMEMSGKKAQTPFWFWEMPIYHQEIFNNEEGLQFIATKRIYRWKDGKTEDMDMLQFELRKLGPQKSMEHQCISDFDFVRKEKDGHEEWNMKHRRTSEVYRNQGIASRMIGIAETFLKKRADEKKIPQILTANTGQVDTLIWLLNSGYTPATEEDAKNIDRTFQGDPDLVIVSGVSEKGRKSRKWYIFERSKYYDENGRQKSGIWSRKNYGKPLHYMTNSVRIQLKKEFRP